MSVMRPAPLAAAVAAALAVGTMPALAQIEEVVVTAQKREQSVNDVPITVTALNAETVQNLGIRSMEDMAASTPGLVVNQTAGTGTSSWSIRGVGFQDYSTAASSTVGIYFDEVAFPYPVMATGQFFDVDRIEVLKGPQGDLYGRNTTGGQVSFVSRKPTDTFEAGVIATYGNFDTLEFEGYASGPFSDRVRGRVAFKTVQRFDGWQESLSRPGDKLGEMETYSVRGLLDIDVTDDLSLLLNVHYNDDQSDSIASTPVDGTRFNRASPLLPNVGPGQIDFFQGATIFSVNDNRAADWTNGPGNALRPQRDNQQYGASAKFVWNVADLEVTSITGYEKFERNEANDWDGSALLDSSNINVTDIWVFSQELRVAGDFGDNVTWLAGLYYAKDEVDEDYNYFFGEGVFGISQLDTNYTVETESIAIFGHVEWDVTDQVGINLGARYTSEDREFDGCTNDASPPDLNVPGIQLRDFLPLVLPPFAPQIAPNACGVVDLAELNAVLPLWFADPLFPGVSPATAAAGADIFPPTILGEVSADEWMWKAGLDFAPNDNLLWYFNISKGFKTGGFNGANLNTVQQLGPYDLEELLSFEVGVKATLLDGAMQLNLAMFRYDYENKQERGNAVTPVGIISGLVNIPESKIFGVEGDLLYYPTDALMINGSFAFLDTEITDYDAVQQGSTLTNIITADASGLALPNAPEWSGNIGAAYDIRIGNGFVIQPAVDVMYRGGVVGAPFEPEQARESYVLANARLSLRSEANDRWRVTAWSRNITDNNYYVSAFGGGNVYFVRTNGMPRTYGLTVDYSFH